MGKNIKTKSDNLKRPPNSSLVVIPNKTNAIWDYFRTASIVWLTQESKDTKVSIAILREVST